MAWGFNINGETDVPTGLTDVIAIAAGSTHNLALKSDGTVVGWGYNPAGETDVPPGLTDVIAISAQGYHSLALKSDGTVVAWGNDFWGESDVPADLVDVTAIAAGFGYSLALKSDGTVVAWGDNSSGQTSVPADLTDVTAIAAESLHNLALKSDGAVVAWGENNHGQTDVPIGLTGVTAIAAGAYHSMALTSDGIPVTWGLSWNGEADVPTGLSDVTAIAAGALHSMALKSDGTVVAWGDNRDGQTDVPPGLTNVIAIAAGGHHSLALRATSAIDTEAPKVTIGRPVPGTSFSLLQHAHAHFQAADELGGSELASVTGLVDGTTAVADGGLLPTDSVGAHTLVVTAIDHAGNTGTATAQYVVFASIGSASGRVKAPPSVNASIKSGAMIPIQFSLGGDYGLGIFETGYPQARQVLCDTFSVDQTHGGTRHEGAAQSQLSYDPTAGQYNYRWKTDKGWAGQCWQLHMKFSGAAEAYAGATIWFNFRFDKQAKHRQTERRFRTTAS